VAHPIRRAWPELGAIVVATAWDGVVHGANAVADSSRPSCRGAITAFHTLGLEPVLVSGDTITTANAVAAEVGVARVIAYVLPEGKVAVIRGLQEQGPVVARAGDGVNDAAAVVQPDLGIAIGLASDVTVDASDLRLVRADLLAAVDAIHIPRKTFGTTRGNLFSAFAYNIVMIPLAAFGMLNPMLAGAALT
jgi:Cu+-exporting ATPase